MRAVDLRTPWGRSAEDVIARKRERYEHTLHRNRLAGIRSTIDCGEPATVDMPHLALRAKQKMLADDAQHRIAIENRQLMEKMMRIIKEPHEQHKALDKAQPSPGTSSVVSSKKGGGVNAPVRRKRLEAIAAQNRVLARRLQDLEPNYAREDLAREHERQRGYLRNISRAHKLEQRLAAARTRSHSAFDPHGADDSTALFSSSSASGGRRDACDDSDLDERAADADAAASARQRLAPLTMIAPSLVLHTARQVRADVARERGYDVPLLLTTTSTLAQDADFEQQLLSGNFASRLRV